MDAKAETAIDGDWRKGPGKDLFDALEKVRVIERPVQMAAARSTSCLSALLIIAEIQDMSTHAVNELHVAIGLVI